MQVSGGSLTRRVGAIVLVAAATLAMASGAEGKLKAEIIRSKGVPSAVVAQARKLQQTRGKR